MLTAIIIIKRKTKHSVKGHLHRLLLWLNVNYCTILTMLNIGVYVSILAYFGFNYNTASFGKIAVSFLLTWLAFGGWKWVEISYHTATRDIRALILYIRLRTELSRAYKKNKLIADFFAEQLEKHPDKACLIFEDRIWTFAEIEEYSNGVAWAMTEAGFKEGDVIAMMMEARPEFVGTWLGLSKVGIVAALINTSLKQQSLIHAILAANAKALIYGMELDEDVEAVCATVNHDFQYLLSGGDTAQSKVPSARSMDQMINRASKVRPPRPKTNMKDPLLYIYTSGTTGLPKAAVISHIRFVYMSRGATVLLSYKDDDVYYDPLPLHHTAGGCIGVGQALLSGIPVVLKKKFSASKYWDDCIKHNCTIAQYIGEICRYLLSQPEKPQDRQHKVRIMFGNGLRPQIWEAFVKRFGIPQIGEFYGATEGNANILNMFNKVGAVGFISRIAPFVYPVTLIRVDEATGEPIRDAKGMCIKCKPGEPGEFVGRIIEGDPLRQFDGYVNNNATQKKIIRNVFRKNDMAFLSGDILVMDDYGYFYFKDRTGDTFRWKGENVSTAEVEAVISNVAGLKDCVVYGVDVPGMEGRAGMAAIVDTAVNSLNLVELAAEMEKCLPNYARPVFLRVMADSPVTSTYKLQKYSQQKDGFNPKHCKSDKLFYWDLKTASYIPLQEKQFNDIVNGQIKL